MSAPWPWLALAGLGAYHGLNPAMGWLFAVALGLQGKSRRAVLRALPPIALGHVISIGIVVGLFVVAQGNLPERPLRYGAAAILLGFGIYRLVRGRHPAWVGMRVGFRDLTLWSFLMASAHGAGLMLVPVLLAWSAKSNTAGAGQVGPPGAAQSRHHLMDHMMVHTPPSARPFQGLAAVGVHSAAYLLVTALVAVLVYEKLGVAILRRAWLNLDLVWGIALLVSAAFVLAL
jgi:hypothetical protein